MTADRGEEVQRWVQKKDKSKTRSFDEMQKRQIRMTFTVGLFSSTDNMQAQSE